jgi:small GTP-binding protein
MESMKNIVTGILAHVDAGKTTCIEAMLYASGIIRKQGRVDHGDSVLDYDEEERTHGITIYDKDAVLNWKENRIFVIDTPGHVDFSAEMERTLQVLDLAVLVISGLDGVQSHTETIWKCLQHYQVPVIIFVNKMDIARYSEEELLNDLKKRCAPEMIAWQKENREDEESTINEAIMNRYLETGKIDEDLVREAFLSRQFFPVLFGSALKNEKIDDLLDAVCALSMEKQYPEEFGAKVYQISTDGEGNRLTHVKVTGGVLKARQKISEEEKADQLRMYTGESWQMVNEAEAGTIVTIKGLKNSYAGQGLGFEKDSGPAVLSGCLDYLLLTEEGTDIMALHEVCSELAAEDPSLSIDFDEEHHAIHVRIMGEIQMEVLQKKIYDRSGISVGFASQGIVYQETITDSVIGVGHFEPLRHYAEVVVRLDPLPRGSGVEVASEVPNGMLSGVFERSILSALSRPMKGVLTGSYLTDVKITLIAGRGSLKHTSGGDFRQAARRAVRQGLMKASCVLLEPYVTFELEVPASVLSRALYDLDQKDADVTVSSSDETALIKGRGPLRTMRNYTAELNAYAHGAGRFRSAPDGTEQVKNQDQIIAEKGYDPLMDLRNPVGSVFCANGSGYYVEWNEVEEHMHIDLRKENTSSYHHETMKVAKEDLKQILENAGSRNRNEKKKAKPARKVDADQKHVEIKPQVKLPKRYLIDGYNCLYSWDCMKEYEQEDLSVAREHLITLVFNYQAYLKCPVTLVFDGYKRKDNAGSQEKRGDLTIVYTRTDVTADAWIEKEAYDCRGQYDLTVVTGDALIQNSILASGASRMSSRELEQQMKLKMVL